MTIEQLLCPAVMTWERDFRKKLNESHIEMTDDEIADEFDKWLVENEDLVNKSVEDNIGHINEIRQRNRKKLNALNEGFFTENEFDDEEGDDEEKENDVEEEPISGEVENETEAEEEENTNSLTGTIRLENSKKSKYNIFEFINDFYSMVEDEKTFEMTHKALMRKLDVSDIKDMTALFAFTNLPNLDLSSWNTGNVKKMEGMFYKSSFNNDSICHWDVTSCIEFKNMFLFCPFNQSLSSWTPGWVEKEVYGPDGKKEMKTVRQDLPILGGTEDETKVKNKIYRRELMKKLVADEEANESNNTLNYVLDYDTFINEGKFRDFINRGVEKVKKLFKTVTLKFGDIIAFFKKDGSICQAVSPYTSFNVISSGSIPGVSAYCAVENDYINDNVKKDGDDIVESPEYYGIIDKDSIEYKNYQTFKSMITEHYEKYGNTGAFLLNEDNYKRVGFSAEDGGVVARDITTEDLKKVLNRVINHAPFYKHGKAGGAVLIWGAPGIGKSTIPKAVIKAWNDKNGDEFHKKGLMVVQCGDLTIDGFSLPIPVEKTIGEYLDERPTLKSQIAKKGISTDTLEKIKSNFHNVSVEAPKTWLPAFKLDATPDEVKVLNDIANGFMDIDYDETGLVKKETTEGGILLFDEFFRANPNIFKILMQLILNRTYSGYMLGDKWGILCCSNRPNDDEEVRTGFEKSGPVLGNRLLSGSYNFIPSFDEWKKWAVKYGGFDNYTIEFLMKDKNPKGEYTNWHTIKPEEYIAKGKTVWPTPRSWSGLMVEINNYLEDEGLSSITEIPEDELRLMADGIIGEEIATKYVNFIRTMSKSHIAVNVKELLENPDYVIPEELQCSAVTKQVVSYIKTVYSPDELPDVRHMMNLFNKINDTYSTSKDNFTKPMHIDIMKFFKITSPKSPNYNVLKDYVNAVDERYNLTPADMR